MFSKILIGMITFLTLLTEPFHLITLFCKYFFWMEHVFIEIIRTRGFLDFVISSFSGATVFLSLVCFSIIPISIYISNHFTFRIVLLKIILVPIPLKASLFRLCLLHSLQRPQLLQHRHLLPLVRLILIALVIKFVYVCLKFEGLCTHLLCFFLR